MKSDSPSFSSAALQGERGVQLVSSIVFDEFGWIFKRNHQEHDFGIDGQIEVVTNDGRVAGQLLAVQIKYGKSFFQEKNRFGYVYRGDAKHFNYLSNYPIPALIILCHPDSKSCYWVQFRPELTQETGSNWKMTVPFANELVHSKSHIEALLPPVRDHRRELEGYWKLNNLLIESGHIHFIIDRSEVRAMDASRARTFFDRLRMTKELALECQGKVEISFFGYESDPRELFEIDELRKYVPGLQSALPELFFFARIQQPTSTLATIALCQTEVSFPHGRSTRTVTRKLEYKTQQVGDFLLRGFAGLNEMTNWLSLPAEDNKRISDAVIQCLGIRVDDA